MYSSPKRAGPTRRSTGGPKTARYSRLNNRCSQPACRNALVSSVTSAAGPSVPWSDSNTSDGTNPQRRMKASSSPSTLNSIRNTATFAAIRTPVSNAQRPIRVPFKLSHYSVCRLEHQPAVLGGVDDDCVSAGEHALEQPNGKWLNELLLDHPLQWSRPVRRVEASPRQLLFGGGRQLETHLALIEPFAEAPQLDLDNTLDLLQPKCME